MEWIDDFIILWYLGDFYAGKGLGVAQILFKVPFFSATGLRNPAGVRNSEKKLL